MKRISIFVLFLIFLSFTPQAEAVSGNCDPANNSSDCQSPKQCLFLSDPDVYACQLPPNVKQTSPEQSTIDNALGKILPPIQVRSLGSGASGISNVLNNAIQLIYVVSGIIFIFMVVFSAVQLIMSGGDKEKIGQARQRLTYAIAGIVLLSIAFVLIKVVGQITGFTFFNGQNDQPYNPATLNLIQKGGACGYIDEQNVRHFWNSSNKDSANDKCLAPASCLPSPQTPTALTCQ